MLRLGRMTDYAIALLGYFAEKRDVGPCNTRELADDAGLPVTTTAKILKQLSDHGLLMSQRGMRGGYVLARPATEITVCEVISALEGPIEMTQGSIECDDETKCPIGRNFDLITSVVNDALAKLTLAQLLAVNRPEKERKP
ncbi:MAG: Rrf2 family transcriptional regulator [Deltaproteobacteria bacterium]|nr:Rrf2 family transcriptional regulator [Deltaproteobacteria bacterium]